MSTHKEFAKTAIRYSSPRQKRVNALKSVENEPELVISSCGPGAPTKKPLHAESNVLNACYAKNDVNALNSHALMDNQKEIHQETRQESLDKNYLESHQDIEEIELSSLQLLHDAVEFSQPEFYYKALTVDHERMALQQRAEQLKHRLDIELRMKSRKLASRYYGWKEVPWSLPFPPSSHMELNSMWNLLRNSTAHEYYIEDPNVSKEFFNQMRYSLVGNELAQFQLAWGGIYGNEIKNSLGGFSMIEDVPSRLLIEKRKSKKLKSHETLNGPSIARRRFEQDIAKREADLRLELATQFKANPVPISSLIPKYTSIMSTRGNRSLEMRQQELTSKRVKNSSKMSEIVQETISDLNRKEAKKKAKKQSSPMISLAAEHGRQRRQKLLENEAKIGLTNEHTFQPKISPSIPNYQKLQLCFEKKLNSKKSNRPPTVPHPFPNLEKHQVNAELASKKLIEKLELQVYKRPEPIKPVRVYPSVLSPECMTLEKPPKLTKAWETTIEHRKQKQQEEVERLKKEKEEANQKEEKNRQMASLLRAKLLLHDQETCKRQKEHHLRFRKEQKRRELQHKQQLNEMYDRVNQRLSLFEQAQISSAKAKAQHEFQNVLKLAGLNNL